MPEFLIRTGVFTRSSSDWYAYYSSRSPEISYYLRLIVKGCVGLSGFSDMWHLKCPASKMLSDSSFPPSLNAFALCNHEEKWYFYRRGMILKISRFNSLKWKAQVKCQLFQECIIGPQWELNSSFYVPGALWDFYWLRIHICLLRRACKLGSGTKPYPLSPSPQVQVQCFSTQLKGKLRFEKLWEV